MADFNKWQLETLTPSWLRGPLGEGLALALGHMKDAFAQAAKQAVKARFPLICPADALPSIGADRMLERMPPETEPSYRARLVAAWEAWAKGGTPEGITDAVVLTGVCTPVYDGPDLVSPRVYDVLHDGWGGAGSWARFWLVLEQPHIFQACWTIGDGTLVADDTVLGYTGATQAQGHLITRQVSKWKGAHARCEGVILVLSGVIIGSGWTIGDGTLIGGETCLLPATLPEGTR